MSNDKSGEKRSEKARLITRIAVGSTVLAAALAVGLLACGCGAKSDDQTAAAPSDQVYVVSQPGGGGQSSNCAKAVPMANEQPAVPSDSLAPDVAVSVDDTLVTPGNPVDIAAEGSADVVTMTLADGLHQKQLFTLDPASGMWHTVYRVPLRSQSDRLGLSVTARNGAGRWRRVWVFLRVQGDDACGSADSTTSK